MKITDRHRTVFLVDVRLHEQGYFSKNELIGKWKKYPEMIDYINKLNGSTTIPKEV